MSALLSRISEFGHASLFLTAIRNPKGLFVLLGFIVLVLYGLSVGKTKALASFLSMYVAYMLTVLFPFRQRLESSLPEHLRMYAMVILFLALYVIVFVLVSSAFRRSRLSMGEISFLKVLLISMVQIGLLASITLSQLSPDAAAARVGLLAKFLVGGRALFVWAAASLLILPFMRSRRRAD